ncbi:MAG: gamma-glutamylcyclotransferase family protein [Opitutaceae bacterium]
MTSPVDYPAEDHLVFVYGTLMRGYENHPFIEGQRFLGEARTRPGYRLHQLTGYPGMVVHPGDAIGIPGELWAVTEACLRELHRLEGVNVGLYAYEPVRLQPPFEHLPTFTYLYLPGTLGRPVIEGGWTGGT